MRSSGDGRAAVVAAGEAEEEARVARPRYVVATDLSRHSRRAGEVAARLAERTGASLHFFCAIPGSVAREYELDVASTRAAVEAVARRHADSARDVTADVAVVGDVPAAILRYVRRIDAALVVVAPRGATGWKRLLLGSVSAEVLRHATCSVLIARPAEPESAGAVLVGVEGPGTGVDVLRDAMALARALGRDLTVVHVVPPLELLLPLVSPGDRSLHIVEARFEAKAREFRRWVAAVPASGPRVHVEVLEGSPAETLLAEARRRRAAFVVVGASERSALRRALLGSVAHAVATTSAASVLVVRPREPRTRGR